MKKDYLGAFNRFCLCLEQNKILMSIRQGLLIAVPFILSGAVALMLKSIPIPAYQEWLQALFSGEAVKILTMIHSVTLGCISLIILITVSLRFEALYELPYKGITPLVSICSYVVLTTGGDLEKLSTVFQSTWVFHALCCVILASGELIWLQKHLPRGRRSFTDGEDDLFQYSINSVLPAAIVILQFALFGNILKLVFGISDLQSIFWGTGEVFESLGRGLGSGLLFLSLMHLMWFFGIHGSNVLDDAGRNVFGAGLDINLQRLAEGMPPTEIISKSFLDTFVLFGGCGTLLCLVVAILLIERRKSIRRLTKIAAFPAVFNINELMLFGLPVILNPVYLIPFLITPLLLVSISYYAAAWGLVPYVVHKVEWTTPIFLSGYVATGSIAGSVLQLVNLAVGTAVYIPFVKFAKKLHEMQVKEDILMLTKCMQDNEKQGIQENLAVRSGREGTTAKGLAGDLREAISGGRIQIFYQPQVDEKGRLLGAEALLRWRYDTGEYLYPPLVIALAEETGQMEELGHFLIQTVCADMEGMVKKFGKDFLVSLNLTAGQVGDGKTLKYMKEELEKRGLSGKQLGVEITEQTALRMTKEIRDSLETMRQLGVSVIMDDFGMGHSSMMYLRENRFDIVKLDGSVVHDVLENKRSRDIISSIIQLARPLDFEIVAEHVETKEQCDVLTGLGCHIYQGYLFGKPMPLTQLLEESAQE